MTIDRTSEEHQASNSFAYLNPYQFIVLTTFRKNGQAVPTTVWFANSGDRLYVTTREGAGKLKRIHNNSRVQIAPSDARGNVLGSQVEGVARELLPSEHERAYSALASKYGQQFEAIASRMEEALKRTYIEIEPAQPA
jgi:uncharacterized protein